MMANVTALSVFAGDRLIGTIHDTSPLSFAYAREWLDHSDGYDIVLTVPRQPGRLDTEAVEAFFENLLQRVSCVRYSNSSPRLRAHTACCWRLPAIPLAG